MTIGAAQQFFLGASKATGGGGAGYQIERSLRFNSSDSAYLSRLPSNTSTTTTWTWSAWVKRSTLGSKAIFGAYYSNLSRYFLVRFSSSDQIEIFGGDYSTSITTTNVSLITTSVYRDTSAWMHIVFTYDTTNAVSSDRARLYINGDRVTVFSTAVYPGPSSSTFINYNTATHYVGAWWTGSDLFDGYLANIHFIDGQALTPSSFTEVSATTGQLVPKAYTGSFGTNGFKLTFSDNSAATATTLGKDTSGNGNNWTPFNLQTTTGGPTSVAAASGALPIYNTTDTYGTTKGSGTRTDINSASIVLAVAMDGANNGTTFTDESATIKGSGSAKSLTRTGTVTSTAQSKFYGSSGYFDGASRLTVDLSSVSLSSAYTVEFWWYKAGTQSGNHGHFCLNGANNQTITYREAAATGTGSNDFYVDLGGTYVPGLITQTINTGSWNHFAFVHEGSGVFKSYLNGVLQTTKTVGTTGTMGSTTSIGGGIGSYTGQFINGYVSDHRIYQAAKYTSNFNPPSSTQNPSIASGNDSLVDTPTSAGTDSGLGGQVTGNYCTWNPLDNAGTLANGNLDFSNGASNKACRSTFALPASGNWYAEFTTGTLTNGASGLAFGFANASAVLTNGPSGANQWVIYSDAIGYIFANGSTLTNSLGTFAAGTTLQIAYDGATGKAWVGKNNVWYNSTGGTTGDPAAGTNQTFTLSGTQFLYTLCFSNSGSLNAGQRPFAYTAPSGFKALCDTNLPSPLIAKPSPVFDVALDTGANILSAAQNKLSTGTDLLWIKDRANANNHQLIDTVRGGTATLQSNTTSVETTYSAPSGSSVAWCWDAGSSTVTNTQGSITSSVRANASAGFSIVTYTGTGSLATVGHGLGAAPSFIIVKARSTTYNWSCYHISTGKDYVLNLNTTGAGGSGVNSWGTAAPTSTVFGVKDAGPENNGSGVNFVVYCFAPVAGYSSFGSYNGNGSADGPFVYTGFRPRWVMLKQSSGSGTGWQIHDTSRNTYNVMNNRLQPNNSDAESTYTTSDFLSNGFKLRDSDPSWNSNGATYIYAAFAESPFQYSRAR